MDNLLQKLMLGGSTAALVAAMSIGASAQDNSDIEQVVVSASRITIAGYTQPTPVTVVGAAQLEQEAFANIADAVRQLPQVSSPPASFGTTQASAAGGQVGTNFVNLRNLGYIRTLVLFDGQRVVASNIVGGVDVTTLPSALISRVDIVTGGASAAWGSDAVAGVANFVLNKNFTGFKATVQGSVTSIGGDRNVSLESAWGDDIFGGRGHVEVAGNVNIKPDTVLLTDANWFKGSYWVSNPTYVAGNGQPQLIVATNVAEANATMGGIINSSPAVTAANSPAGTAVAANALRGIQFVGAGIPQLVNLGNVTLGTLSNGGSLTDRDAQQAWATLANPTNTYTLFGFGRYKLTDTIQASVQLNYGYFTGKGSAPSIVQTALTIKSDNAFIPASVRATMQANGITSFTMGTLNGNNFDSYTATGDNYYSQAEASMAPGVAFARRNLMRGVFTLEGTIGDDWSWNSYVQYSTVRLSDHATLEIVANVTAAQDAVTVTTANRGTANLPLGSIACRSSLPGQAAVVSGNVTAQPGCIPLDVFGQGVASPAAIGYITGASTNSSDFVDESLNQVVAEGSMQGTLPWQLPAGKIAVAFGAGYRKEAGVSIPTPIAVQGGYAAGNFSSVPSSSYNVVEGFAEVDAPILKNNIVNSLDFSVAGRMTNYSTSGLVETWKLGAASQVNDDIRLRTTWSVDVRAPQLGELFTASEFAVGSQRDPKSNLTTSALVATPGNPGLDPEVARTVSGGVVVTPHWIDGLSLSADWYSIDMTGLITKVPQATILAQCNSSLPSPVHPGQNGNPNDPLCTYLTFNGPSGALSNIFDPTLNFARLTTSGLDLQANYTMDFWEGSLAWSALANLNDETTLTQPGSGVNDFAGSNATAPIGDAVQPGPKWRGVLSTTYTTGPYSFTAQTRWFGTSVTQQNGNTGNQASAATANLYDPAHFELPFTAYLDLRASYKWNDNISLYGAIDNALDTPPPLDPALSADTQFWSSNEYGNTNVGVYNTLGRAIRVGVRFNY